jgi:hypothetical protein
LDWQGQETALACLIDARENAGVHLFVAFNNSGKEVTFPLPQLPWVVNIHTDGAPEVGGAVKVSAQSLVVLTASA